MVSCMRVDRRWRLIGCVVAFLALLAFVRLFKVIEKKIKDDPDKPIFIDFKKYIYKEGRPANQSIPKIIHQIWSDEIIPDQFVDHIKSMIKYNQHPEWSYYFWTLDVGREFIRQKYPKLLPMYDMKDKITKANIIRTVAVYHFGGAYFDLDIACVRPLDRFVDNHECAIPLPIKEFYVAYETPIDYRGVNNAILLCRAGHPFFKLLIERTEKGAELCNTKQACPEPDYPHPLLVYLTENGIYDVIPELAESHLFDGLYDPVIEKLLEQKCSKDNYVNLEKGKQEICENWKAKGKGNLTIPEDAYTFHTWYHSNARRVTTDSKNKISNIVPHVKSYDVVKEGFFSILDVETNV